MWKNIIGTVGTAFALNASFTNGLIYGWSLFNSFFRVTLGWGSDKLTELYHPRAWLLLITGCIAFLVNILYLPIGEAWLWPLNIADAMVYGAAFTITATQVSTNFGLRSYGFNMGLASLAPAFSGLICTSLSTSFTNAVAESNGEEQCYGDDCFSSTFIMGAVCLVVGVLFEVTVLRHEARELDKQRSSFDLQPADL